MRKKVYQGLEIHLRLEPFVDIAIAGAVVVVMVVVAVVVVVAVDLDDVQG